MIKQKYLLLRVCSLIFCTSIWAQEEPDEILLKNQVSTNLTYLLTGTPDINYERTLGKHFAIGIGGSLYSDGYRRLEIPDGEGFEYSQEYEITPFGRWYMNGTQRKSHFLELFMSINGGEESDRAIRITNSQGFGVYVIGTEEVTNVGLGGAYGYRFLLLEKRLVLEASLGLRTNFENTYGILNVGIARAGIKVGYRF